MFLGFFKGSQWVFRVFRGFLGLTRVSKGFLGIFDPILNKGLSLIRKGPNGNKRTCTCRCVSLFKKIGGFYGFVKVSLVCLIYFCCSKCF